MVELLTNPVGLHIVEEVLDFVAIAFVLLVAGPRLGIGLSQGKDDVLPDVNNL